MTPAQERMVKQGMARTTDAQTVTVRIPAKEGSDLQRVQLGKVYHLAKEHVRKTRGLRAEYRFRKDFDALFMREGTTYEQIRSEMERMLNLLLEQEKADLVWIASQ